MRFYPVDASIDLKAACEKWSPGTGPGALGVFQDALPQLGEMVFNMAFAFWAVMHNSHRDLQATLNINFVHTTAQVYALLWKASQLAAALPGEFAGTHQDYIQRRATAGAQTSNVGAGTPAG